MSTASLQIDEFCGCASAIIDMIGVGTFGWNVQSGALDINERWDAIRGHPKAEVTPLSDESRLERPHPDRLPGFKELWVRHFTGETELNEFEYRVLHIDGNWVWVLCHGRVMSRTIDGRPEWLLATLTDITERKQRDAAILKREEFLDRLEEIAIVGGWELDLASNEVFWSKQMRRIHGVPFDYQPTLEATVAFYAPDVREKIKGALAWAATDGRPWDLELPLLRADGRQIWVHTAGVVSVSDGKPVRITGALQDVTVRNAERQTLQNANEHLQLATDGGGIGIWDWDIAKDRMTWDAKMHELYGPRAWQDVETFDTWSSHLHPEDRSVVEQAMRDGIAGRQPFDIEFRIIWDDGTVRHIRGAGLVTRDAGGHPVQMIGTNLDITAHKLFEAERLDSQREMMTANAELERMANNLTQACDAAERARTLLHEQNRFRAAVDAMQGVLWTTDAAGRMVGEQPGWGKLTGQTIAEYQGYGWADAVYAEDAQPTLDAWNQAVASGCTFVFEHRIRRIDGAWRIFAVRAVPLLKPDGHIFEWVGVHTDISEQRQAERALLENNADLEKRVDGRTIELERLARHLAKARDTAEQASRAKSRFLAGMSHELRTPLNGILGYAQMLRLEGDLNVTQSARVDAMLGAGNHLLGMITAVLDMSEIETGHVVMDIEEVDLSNIASVCLDMVGAAAEAKGLSLSISTMRGAPRKLITDATRLRQVLLNLLGNAVKFTTEGCVELRLRASANGEGLRIEVADTGPGIPAKFRTRLFQDFERLDNRVTAAIEGSGLGLALSARLVALLGGHIGHNDNSGGGSVFWLELPLVVAGASLPCAMSPMASFAKPGTMQMLRILVADDVEMNREIVKSFLHCASHDVTFVVNGSEAVAAAAQTDFDVILMDVRMPEVDGLEATRRIRRLAGRRGRVPIIGLTAQAFAGQVADCRAAGMDAHMPKPFSQDALLQAVIRAAGAGQVPAKDPTSSSDTPAMAGGAMGEEWPVIDDAIAGKLTACMSATRIMAGLEKIARDGELLLGPLSNQDVHIQPKTIVEELHALAGTAGLFGFTRLARVGQQFEHAVGNHDVNVPALLLGVHAAIEATVHDIRRRVWPVNLTPR